MDNEKTPFEQFVKELKEIVPYELSHDKNYALNKVITSSHYTAPEIMSERVHQAINIVQFDLKGYDNDVYQLLEKYKTIL